MSVVVISSYHVLNSRSYRKCQAAITRRRTRYLPTKDSICSAMKLNEVLVVKSHWIVKYNFEGFLSSDTPVWRACTHYCVATSVTLLLHMFSELRPWGVLNKHVFDKSLGIFQIKSILSRNIDWNKCDRGEKFSIRRTCSWNHLQVLRQS